MIKVLEKKSSQWLNNQSGTLFNENKESKDNQTGVGDNQLLKQRFLDQNSLFAITLVDLLQNIVDGIQLILAFKNINILESMNSYINSDKSEDETEEFESNGVPFIILTAILDLIILITIIYTRRDGRKNNIVAEIHLNVENSNETLSNKLSTERYKYLQIGIVQLRILFRIEVLVSTSKEFIAISDILTLLITIMWISEKQSKWMHTILLIDFNVIYFLTRQQIRFNIFSLIKSLFLILIIIFQFRNQVFLEQQSQKQQQQNLFTNTTHKFIENSNMSASKSLTQQQNNKNNINYLRPLTKSDFNPLLSKQTKKSNKFQIQDDEKGVEVEVEDEKKENKQRISFQSQMLFDYNQQSNIPSLKKISPMIANKLTLRRDESTIFKINPSVMSMMDMIPSQIFQANYRKQSVFRKRIISDHLIDSSDRSGQTSNLSLQVLNQINQGIVLMNLNECIVFHNKKILDILSINKSSKIIQKLFQLKKESKVKEGDLLDQKNNSTFVKKNTTCQENKKSYSKTAQCIQNNDNQKNDVSGKSKSPSHTNVSSSTSINDLSKGSRIKSVRGAETKKKTYLNNKSQSTCDFLMLPSKQIFNNNNNNYNNNNYNNNNYNINNYNNNNQKSCDKQKNQALAAGDDEDGEDQMNGDKSIREVEEDQDSEQNQSTEKESQINERNFCNKKSEKNIKKLRQSLAASKKVDGDEQKLKKGQFLYSTDEKSFEVIIQEIISLISLYRQNITYRPCKSENNLDQNTIAQEELMQNCERTIHRLQEEGYTFNAILDNTPKKVNHFSSKNIISANNQPYQDVPSKKNNQSLNETSFNKIQTQQNPSNFVSDSQQITSKNLNESQQQQLQEQQQQEQQQQQQQFQQELSVTKIISVQIKLWNQPTDNNDEINELSTKREKKNIQNIEFKKPRNISQIIAEKMQVPMLFIIIKDITKQIEQEEQDRMNRFKLKILSSISHELRTPLNCSMIMLQMLIQSELISQTVKSDYLEPAFFNNQLLYFIINDILDYAQISQNSFQLKFSSFELYQALQDCLNLFSYSAEFKGISLSLSIDPSIPAVINSDQERIKQVLINLISNALKYTTVGSVSVKVFPSLNQKDIIEISVEDTGCGIPPHLHQDIFEYMDNPTQKKQDLNSNGAGLGLTISQKIVRGLSGSRGISLESEEGVGSTFTFYVKNKEPALQKSAHGKKNNQFNNIFLNWKSMSFTTFQSQEFKSDLSSIKGLTNKSQLTPQHASSPHAHSLGLTNIIGSKEEIDRKLLLNMYAKRNSYMRKGSKFLEENFFSRDLTGLTNPLPPLENSGETSHLNVSERRQSRSNQLSVKYNDNKFITFTSGFQEQENDSKRGLLDQKQNLQNRSYDVIESFSELESKNSKNSVQAFQPFQGHSSISYQDSAFKKLVKEQTNVSTVSLSSFQTSEMSNQKSVPINSQANNQQVNHDNINLVNRNLRNLTAQQSSPSPNTSVSVLLNPVKEINDESIDLDSTNNVFTTEKNNTTRMMLAKPKIIGSVSPVNSEGHNQSFNDIYSNRIIDGKDPIFINISNNSSTVQETPQLKPKNNKLLNKSGQESNNNNSISFNSTLNIESERDPVTHLEQIIIGAQIPIKEQLVSGKQKSSEQITNQAEQLTQIKINNKQVRSSKNIEPSNNDLDGGDMDKLIQKHSKEQLQLKQDQLKRNLHEYFDKKQCKCNQVLIVDDNQFNVLVMKKLLSSYFVNADQAFNGKNAFDLVVQKATNTNYQCCLHYKLILMDIDMPVMNGYESTQAILDYYKDNFKKINPPIISACTAYVSNEDKSQAQKRGMKFFLGKPIQVYHLDLVLEYCLLKKKK